MVLKAIPGGVLVMIGKLLDELYWEELDASIKSTIGEQRFFYNQYQKERYLDKDGKRGDNLTLDIAFIEGKLLKSNGLIYFETFSRDILKQSPESLHSFSAEEILDHLKSRLSDIKIYFLFSLSVKNLKLSDFLKNESNLQILYSVFKNIEEGEKDVFKNVPLPKKLIEDPFSY